MEKALELESRKTILELIRSRPGTYLREIERELGMGIGMLTYNLKVLVDAGMIRTEKEGNHLRYFVSNDFMPQNRKMLSYLRNRSSRMILIHALDLARLPVTAEQLTGLSPSTVNFHLKAPLLAMITIQRGMHHGQRVDRTSWLNMRCG
jgi:predicted transcriptional regulator